MITLVYPYFENPGMLRRQVEIWREHKGTRIILVDDCSERFPAVDVVNWVPKVLGLEVYRIKTRIPWNVAGARNLGCSLAEGWILVNDIADLVPAADLRRLAENLDDTAFYQVPRVLYPSGRQVATSPVNLLFHKSAWLELGGYDEDFSGSYGLQSIEFKRRLMRVRTMKEAQRCVWYVPAHVEPSGESPGDRTLLENAPRYLNQPLNKKAGPILRFEWERVV